MGIKHVVFDWDGTLADTYPVISAAYDYVFKCLDIEASRIKQKNVELV